MMQVQSEFDRYINMSYVELGKLGGFCHDNGRFLRRRKMAEAIDDLEETIDRNDELATNAIIAGDVNILEKSNQIDSHFEFICAKMELEFVSPNYRQN